MTAQTGQMQYTRFRGLELSRLALGTWVNFRGKVSDAENRKIFTQCLKMGINVIDTAGSYENGGAETLLSQFIKPALRKELFISSKVYHREVPGVARAVTGLNKKAFRVSIDESLQRLKTDYLDLLYLHRYDETAPLDDIVFSIDAAMRAGKILYWGVSRWPLEKLAALIDMCTRAGVPLPSAMQESCNYLFPLPGDVQASAHKHRMALFLYSPLARGALSGKYEGKTRAPAGSRGADKRYAVTLGNMDIKQQARLAGFLQLASSCAVAPAELAYRYVMDSYAHSIVLCGFSKASQVSEVKAILRPAACEIAYG